MKKGLIHVYTGDGKGKTTAACGLALRALGQGFSVLFIQFLKPGNSGEISELRKLKGIHILCSENFNKFIWEMTEDEKRSAKAECMSLFLTAIRLSEHYDMLILDEVMGCIQDDMIEETKLIEFIKNKPIDLELVFTGRNSSEEIIGLADYVSEIKMIKHPFEKGMQARRGIEF